MGTQALAQTGDSIALTDHYAAVIERLRQSPEPIIRYNLLARVLPDQVSLVEIAAARGQIPDSPRVRAMLSERDERGTIPRHPYGKWQGAHWVLAILAEVGYPPDDTSLIPLRDQVYQWLLSKDHLRSIRQINGRVRRCASQESNALYSALTLGIADERADELAERLANWQWPDGGWNCDKKAAASHSSFHESLIPLRALALHGQLTGSQRSLAAAERTAQLFLSRRLFRRLSDGTVMDNYFLLLHYPYYWHYNILGGLRILAETGYIHDSRCDEALDLLESKRLADGSFPAETKYYRVTDKEVSGRSLADWGGTSKRQGNEFVTVEALAVLRAAGRL
jgi:hypothetical protein